MRKHFEINRLSEKLMLMCLDNKSLLTRMPDRSRINLTGIQRYEFISIHTLRPVKYIRDNHTRNHKS